MAIPFDENYILQDDDEIRQFFKTYLVGVLKTTIYYPDELNGPEKGDKYDEADGLHTAKGYIYKEKEMLEISIRSSAEPENLGTVNSTNNMHSQEGRVCKSEDPEGAVPNERQPDIQNLQPNNVQRHNSETCPVRVLIRTKRTGQNSLPYEDTYSMFSKADDTHAHDHSSTIDCSRGRCAQATTRYKICETPMNNSVLTGTYSKTQLNIPECAVEHDKLSEFPMSSTPGRPTASKTLWREASFPHCLKLSTTTGQMYTDGKQCLSEVIDVGKQTDNTHVPLMWPSLMHDDHTSIDGQHIENSLANSDHLSSVDPKNCLDKYLRVNCGQRYSADCDYKYPVGGHPRNVIDSSGLAVMRFESWRLSTFSHVQNRLAVSTLRLANSGFYYDEERDDIVCFSCNLRKRDWDKSDAVAVVHLELSPDCDQANFRDDRNVPVSKYPHVGPTDESSVLPGLSQQTHHGSRDDSGGFSTDGESTDASGATGTGFSAISTSQTFHTDPQSAAENNRNASRDNIPQRDPESSTKYPSSGTPFSGKTHTNSSLAAQSAETVVQHVSLSPLANLAGFTPPVGNDKTGQLYPTTTTTQAPSACSTPPTAQHHRYPVQPEQDRNAVPNQSGSSVPRRRDDEPVEVYNSFDVRRAVSPGNASVSARLASFVDWPARGLPSPRLLVIAGFYYLGAGDSVRCFYCGVTLRNWRETDDPWETHVRFRFSCDYVIFIKGDDFVLQTSLKIANRQNIAITNGGDSSDAPSSTTDPNGASEGARVSMVSSSAASNATTSGSEGQRETSGEGASNAATNPANGGEACNGTALRPSQELRVDAEGAGASNGTDRQTTTTTRSHATQQAVTSGSRSTTCQSTVSREHPAPRSTTRTVDNRDEVTYLQRLQEANRRLRQRQTCRLCGDRAVDTIFLPCGHLCTCESCAATIRECCLCHDRIRGTAHVYLE